MWGPWTDENSCSRPRRSAWVIRLDSEGGEKPFEGEKARLLGGGGGGGGEKRGWMNRAVWD